MLQLSHYKRGFTVIGLFQVDNEVLTSVSTNPSFSRFYNKKHIAQPLISDPGGKTNLVIYKICPSEIIS